MTPATPAPLEQMKKVTFVDETIEGFGSVHIKRLKSPEFLAITGAIDESDTEKFMREVTAASVHVEVAGGDEPVKYFSSGDDLLTLDWDVAEGLKKAALKVNRLNKEEAEKKSDAPPSSA